MTSTRDLMINPNKRLQFSGQQRIFHHHRSRQRPVTGTSYTSQYDVFTIGAGYLDVWAALNSTDVAGSPSSALSNYYFKMSGTSMAAPVVSGAAALLIQQHPGLTPDQVKARLMKTATKAFPSSSIATDPATGASYTSQYDVFTIGVGYLDLGAALKNTDAAAGSAASPTAVHKCRQRDHIAIVCSQCSLGIERGLGDQYVGHHRIHCRNDQRRAVSGLLNPIGNKNAY